MVKTIAASALVSGFLLVMTNSYALRTEWKICVALLAKGIPLE